MNRIRQAKLALSADGALSHFMSTAQRSVLHQALQGEEAEGMADVVLAQVERVVKMPVTYRSGPDRRDSLVHLHYFGGAANFWIIEKDVGDTDPSDSRQHQAYGLANMFGGPEEGEWGYISIEELIQNGIELDLYWTPVAAKDLT